jgi:Tol biopolymer transport system component
MSALRKATVRLAGCAAATALVLVAVALTASSATASFPGVNGKIAFSRCEDGYSCKVSKIWTMNADGSGQSRLLQDPGYWDDDLTFSADGRKLVFQRCTETTHDCGIATVDAHGYGVQQLTPLAQLSSDDAPSFSPDGGRIVFNRIGPGQALQIWIMASDGSNAHALTDGSASDAYAEFSPDGTRIVFSRYASGSSRIWIMNVDGSNQHPVTDAANRSDEEPTFSPDGKKVAFVGCVTGGTCAIWTVGVDGSGVHQVTSPTTGDGQPAFSPDGTRVVFQRQLADYTTRVFTQALSGGSASQLTFSNDFYVSWSSVPTPSIDSPPKIAGVAQAGHALTATAGPSSWGGTASFQWLRCANACTPIAGATATTYKPTNADIGKIIEVRQTQTSAGGSVSAASAATAPVAGEPGARLVGLARKGKARLVARLTCPATQSVLCDGRLTLTARMHGHSVKLAARSFRLASGTDGTLALHAPKTPRKASTLTARVVTRDDAGNTTTTRSAVRLKRG